MVFNIPLAEQKVKPHQVTALHLVMGFALLGASALALLLNNLTIKGPNGEPIDLGSSTFDIVDGTASLVMLFSVIIIIMALFRNKWLRSDKVNRAFRILELGAAIIAAMYLLTIDANVPAAIFVLLAGTVVFSLVWEGSATKTLSVEINEQGIKPPMNLKRRNINWVEVDKVLLRHGNLTINCADNRMYQWTTSKHDTDTEIFEAFCDAQIEAAKKLRKEDW